MSTAQIPQRAKIVIVGAGPVGLTAALVLARAGAEVEILEATNKLVDDLRTTIIQPSSLEIWHALGASEGFFNYGTICHNMQFREREAGLVANLGYDCLDGETKFPHIMLCALPFVVPELYRTLLETGQARVHFDTRLDGATLLDNGVRLTVAQAGTTRQIDANFVIAADGTRSVARDTFPIHRLRVAPGNRLYRMTVADSVDKLIPDIESFSYLMDPQCYGLILKNPGFWRIPVGLGTETTDDENGTSDAKGASLIKDFIFPGHEVEITASRPLVVTNWVASEFGTGNILFAGDSAHAMNPMAGLGMNSGILDAVDAAIGVLEALALGRPGPRWARYVTGRPRVARDIAVRALNRYTLLTETSDERRESRNRWLKETSRNDTLRRERLREYSLLDHYDLLRNELGELLERGRPGLARREYTLSK